MNETTPWTSIRVARKATAGIVALAMVMTLCLMALPTASAAYTWTGIGAPAGSAYPQAMAFDKANNILYAAFDNGQVFKYASGAWTDTALPSGVYIYDMFVDPSGVLYCAARDMNYPTYSATAVIYSDSGWMQIGAPIATEVIPLCIQYSTEANLIFVGCSDGFVYGYNVNDPGWFQVGMSPPVNDAIQDLAYDSDNDILYVASDDPGGTGLGCVYRLFQGTWELYGTFPDSYTAASLEFDQSRNVLYAGLSTTSNGIPNVYRRSLGSGGGWTAIGTLCGGPFIYDLEMDVANDFLFAAPYDGHVYKNALASAGSTWTDTGAIGTEIYPVREMAYSPGDSTLYACSFETVYRTSLPRLQSISPMTGALGWTLDVTLTATNGQFTSQSQAIFSGDGVKVNSTTRLSADQVRVNITINPETYTGPRNVWVKTGGDQTTRLFDGFIVTPRTDGMTWYLAEGTNAWGFSTYMTIANTSGSTARAKVTWLNTNGAVTAAGKGVIASRIYVLPAQSQTTISSSEIIGNVDFSTKVECLTGEPIAVDRTMFWTGEGQTSPGYHNSIGAAAPSKIWYMPEGSSNWGFETWTEVLNPNTVNADLTLTYMTADGPRVVTENVPPNARATFSMFGHIGNADASLKITSDQPVVAERSMYRNNRREGSCSIGATTPATEYFLAEGAVGYASGFKTYVLVQNPNDAENQVTLSFQTQAGEVKGDTFTLGANSRKTVLLNDELPDSTDVSTKVTGSKPLIAERAMYWDGGEAFHASIGLSAPHPYFLLPDGQSSGGFETWTLVENPNPVAADVAFFYLPADGSAVVTLDDTIPAFSRRSYNMADKVPSGRASTLVFSVGGGPVIVERSMYMNQRSAGTNTIGGFAI